MALGKGLSSLISEETMDELNQAYISDLDIKKLQANPYQPRISIDQDTLTELASSIKQNGVIEPLLVTKIKGGKYQIIAGERRWRAAKKANLKTVPVVVKEASPQQMLELAIIENIQRKDLNPFEEALAFKQLKESFDLTDKDIAQKIGFSRTAVTNKIRLLTLPDGVKKLLLEDKISEGHSRALLGLRSQEAMEVAGVKIYQQKLSVRATEELVRRLNHGQPKIKRNSNRIIDEYTQELESNLQNKFGTKAKLFRSKKGGKIVIPFKSDKDLKEIYSLILQN